MGLVCHPHPLGGGTMHNKVVFRAAAGLLDAGLITLRFNFRGVGKSVGTFDNGVGETTADQRWFDTFEGAEHRSESGHLLSAC